MNRKIKNRNNYVVIYSIAPKEYLNNSKLNSTDKLLLFHITALCHKNGYCTATNRYFMRIYGFSKTTISKAINKLIKLNILKTRRCETVYEYIGCLFFCLTFVQVMMMFREDI